MAFYFWDVNLWDRCDIYFESGKQDVYLAVQIE